jgi:hypothetical protein
VPFCHFCGEPIHGQSKPVKHRDWSGNLELKLCDLCYQSKPRCWVCELPIASTEVSDVCPTCAESMRTCLACRGAIDKNYFEIEGVGVYCKNCIENRRPCDVCGAPLTDDRWQLSDGRISCAHCHTTAVYDPKQASALYEEMKLTIQENLGLKLNVPTGLALVDRQQLADVIRQQLKNVPQSTAVQQLKPNRTLGIYTRRGLRRGIYVQNGLPRMLLMQIVAHEFAHAWQGENCPLLEDALIREGFAEWVAYKILGYYGYEQKQKQMLSREDVYGSGLNWALEVERNGGHNAVIEACRKV